MFSRLRLIDRSLFLGATGAQNRHWNAVLPRLSRLADRSVLWMVVAALLAAGGGRFGKRAALRGLVSISATSLLANQPLKRIARRSRPVKLAPAARLLVKLPASYSFPSGHAASAAAFATGVSLELPLLALPMGFTAAGVAVSRVYTGVHYPGDVAAGAAIGLAVALSTQKLWPLAPHEPAQVKQVFTAADAASAHQGEGVGIVVNRAAGSRVFGGKLDELKVAFPRADFIEVEGQEGLEQALQDACRRSRIIGAAGGDGTINAAASAALAAGLPLLVIPGGTLNHLARDLGVSSVQDAARGLEQGHAAGVDVGRIAGQPFLNTASFGSYTELVDVREKLEPRIGKWPSMIIALFKVLRSSDPIEVELNGVKRRLWMIFIGNCCYRPSGFAPTWRERLDDRKLDVRLVDAKPPWGRSRLLLAVLSGTLAKTRVYEEFAADRLSVRSLQGPLRLARDGEVFDGPAEFTVEKYDRPLPIYRPQPGAPAQIKAPAFEGRRRGVSELKT